MDGGVAEVVDGSEDVPSTGTVGMASSFDTGTGGRLDDVAGEEFHLLFGDTVNGDGHTIGEVHRLKNHCVTEQFRLGVAILPFYVDWLAMEGGFEQKVKAAAVATVDLDFEGLGGDFGAIFS